MKTVESIEQALGYQVTAISTDQVSHYGYQRSMEGATEIIGQTAEGEIFEVGYYTFGSYAKDIINISPQSGCPSRCKFCELGGRPLSRSLSPLELFEQVVLSLQFASQRGVDVKSKQHKVSLAKSGDSLFNREIVEGLGLIGRLRFSFKISTVMPAATSCKQTFKEIAQFASSYEKAVQLQISMISTSDAYRKEITGNVASSIAEIAEAIRFWQKLNPLPQGRKPNINIIVTEEVPISAKEIYQVLPPGLARFRFRPYIPNQYGKSNRLSLVSTERYRSVRAEFLEAGYEVSAWGNPPETIWRFGLAANAELERYRERVKQDPGLML